MDVERALRLLGSEHIEDQLLATEWIEEHAQEVLPRIRELLRADPATTAGLAAIGLLGVLGGRDEVVALRSLMKVGGSVAWAAAMALARHSSALAMHELIDATASDNMEEAQAAAVALGEKGDQRARQTLLALLDHHEEAVRYRAVYALRSLGANDSAAELLAHRRVESSPHVVALIDEALEQRRPQDSSS